MLACIESRLLMSEYAIRSRRYAEAVTRIGYCTNLDSFDAAYAEAQQALANAEEVRISLQEHVETHHCLTAGVKALKASV